MKILGFEITRPKRKPSADGRQKRGFDSGVYDRLNADWRISSDSVNTNIQKSLATARPRSRDLEANNAYGERYFKLLVNNVLGSEGVGLQNKAMEPDGKGAMKFDTVANSKIEAGWLKWGRKEFCSLDGSVSWNEGCRITLRSAARDGSAFARIIEGADNPFKFAVHWMPADCLDTNYSGTAPNGNKVILGVELQEYKVKGVKFFKVVAYWMYPHNPFEQFTMSNRVVERIPAEDIVHPFIKTQIGQVIGFPWLSPVMRKFRDLGKYEEAELVAAREGACKGYYLKKSLPSEWTGPENDAGEALQPTEPGMGIDGLPGEEYVPINPTHPTDAFPYFVKAQLRALSAGLGVSYNSLANDLESVNYSSIRAGRLEELEEWKGLQNWFIESFIGPIFNRWLPVAMLSGEIQLPIAKLEKFNKPEWKARRWPWIDPLKDLQAHVLAVEKGFNSQRRIVAEGGGDIEVVFDEIAEDKKLAKAKGLDFSDPGTKEANTAPKRPPKPDDDNPS